MNAARLRSAQANQREGFIHLHGTPEALDAVAPRLNSMLRTQPRLITLTGFMGAVSPPPTPRHWKDDCETSWDARFLALCEAVGTPIGYPELQAGRLVQDIFPIRQHAHGLVEGGCVPLELHTEDPALQARADYMVFLCLSNQDRVPTRISSPELRRLPAPTLARLARPCFPVRTDRPWDCPADTTLCVSPVTELGEGRYRMIYDPAFLVTEQLDPLDAAAFAELQALVEGSVEDLLLSPGEMAIVDNYQVAHGRPRYAPRYDGTDRWLKRALIARSR